MNTPLIVLDKPFSEVVFATSALVIAQCYKEYAAKSYAYLPIVQGSAVRVVSSYDNSYNAYGFVTKINNTSLDSVHKPTALGMNLQEIESLQPQIYDLLRKEIEICLFAFRQKENFYNYPPVKPVMVHDFVHMCSDNELLRLTNEMSSLFSMIKVKQLQIDILYDLIMKGYSLRKNNYSYLVNIGQKLTVLYQDDIENLMRFLKRMSLNCNTDIT